MKKNLLALFAFTTMLMQSQINFEIPGTPGYLKQVENANSAKVQNGSGTIATSYTNTACGLNFTQASVRLNQRLFSITPQTGMLQPATFSISGIPSCASILKAFIYSSASGPNTAITLTVTNPASSTSTVALTNIGTHVDKCWGYGSSQTYRADVTSLISGSGNYVISGFPVIVGSNDTDGATLFIIYSDPSQNYTGSIVMADGCFVRTGGTGTVSISGFNVCATPTLASNFILVADLQKTAAANMMFNSSSFNYIHPIANQFVYDFVQTNVSPVVASQSVATFGVDDPSDCFNFALAGMYYRTSCMTCTTSTVPGVSVTAVASPSCGVGSATATASGGTGPYSYTWSPSGGNASTISGVPPGIYTVSVKDASASSCGVATATVNLSNVTPTLNALDGNMCAGSSTTLTAFGATTYSWNTGATSASIAVSPSVTTNYVVTGYNGNCANTLTINVTVNPQPTLTAVSSSSMICAGQSVTLTANGAASYTFNPGNITGNPIAVSPSVTTTYNVFGVDGNGCSDSTVLVQFVTNCTGISENNLMFEINVMPNPTQGDLYLIINAKTENLTCELINVLGQIVLKQTISESKTRLKINEQASGIYYLRVLKQNSVIYDTKIVKE